MRDRGAIECDLSQADGRWQMAGGTGCTALGDWLCCEWGVGPAERAADRGQGAGSRGPAGTGARDWVFGPRGWTTPLEPL